MYFSYLWGGLLRPTLWELRREWDMLGRLADLLILADFDQIRDYTSFVDRQGFPTTLDRQVLI